MSLAVVPGSRSSAHPQTPGWQKKAEGAWLAAMIVDPAVRQQGFAVPPGWWTTAAYAPVLQALRTLDSRQAPIDFVTVAAEATAQGYQAADAVLAALPPAESRYHALLQQAYLDRQARALGQWLATNPDRLPPDTLLAQVQQRAQALQTGPGPASTSVQDAMAAGIQSLQNGPPGYFRSGLPALDGVLDGVGPGDLVVVGARPSQGKTSYGLQIAEAVADTLGGVFLATLEMSPQSLGLRILAHQAQVAYSTLVHPPWTPKTQHLVHTALQGSMSSWPLQLWSLSGATVLALQQAVQRQHTLWEAQGIPLRVVLVDYLQLLEPDTPDRWRDRELAQITTGLKRLATTQQVLVVALAQLSRAVDQRPDKRPMLSDLRESGRIEQDADAVVLIHRPPAGEAELIVAKQRNGPTGSIPVSWQGPAMQFVPV